MPGPNSMITRNEVWNFHFRISHLLVRIWPKDKNWRTVCTRRKTEHARATETSKCPKEAYTQGQGNFPFYGWYISCLKCKLEKLTVFFKNDFTCKSNLPSPSVSVSLLLFCGVASWFFLKIKSLLYISSYNFFFITVFKVLLHLKSDRNLCPC